MRVVVCEDEPFYQTAIAEAIERWQSASGHTDVELSVFSSSEDVLEAIEHEAEIDLLFVDIQIPGEMSGIDLARRIRERPAIPQEARLAGGYQLLLQLCL